MTDAEASVRIEMKDSPGHGTPSAEAAILRITGVVAHTEFAVEDYNAPVSVRLDSHLAGFEEGDTAKSLIGRSRKVDLKAAA